MAKELIARGQATICTQTDAYTVYLSRQSYVVSTGMDGRIETAVTLMTVVSAMKGTIALTPVIGTLPSVAGCTLSKSETTVTVVFNTGVSLADSGLRRAVLRQRSWMRQASNPPLSIPTISTAFPALLPVEPSAGMKKTVSMYKFPAFRFSRN